MLESIFPPHPYPVMLTLKVCIYNCTAYFWKSLGMLLCSCSCCAWCESLLINCCVDMTSLLMRCAPHLVEYCIMLPWFRHGLDSGCPVSMEPMMFPSSSSSSLVYGCTGHFYGCTDGWSGSSECQTKISVHMVYTSAFIFF